MKEELSFLCNSWKGAMPAHNRYANRFSLGNALSLTISKTMAAIGNKAPVFGNLFATPILVDCPNS